MIGRECYRNFLRSSYLHYEAFDPAAVPKDFSASSARRIIQSFSVTNLVQCGFVYFRYDCRDLSVHSKKQDLESIRTRTLYQYQHRIHCHRQLQCSFGFLFIDTAIGFLMALTNENKAQGGALSCVLDRVFVRLPLHGPNILIDCECG